MWCAHTLLPYANYRAGSSTVVQSSDIHDTDHTKRDALQKAIAYTAKVDTAVRLSLLQRARKYRRGECLLQTGKKRGRPRNNVLL